MLREGAEEFRGAWSYRGVGRFYVTIFAEDEVGNGEESRPLADVSFYSPDRPWG